MKTLHFTPAVDFIAPLFYGGITLNTTKQELLEKFAEHDIIYLTTENGLRYLKIHIENATLNCFLNPDGECYTCWIFFDKLNDPEPYILFYNKYLPLSPDNTNYWLTSIGAIELLKDKGDYYLIIV